jgi:hypothetical protein
MNYTLHQSCVRTLKSTDQNFHIRDGFIVAPRAGFEISQLCPKEYKLVIQDCISKGWLKPVANVTDQELMWMSLKGK